MAEEPARNLAQSQSRRNPRPTGTLGFFTVLLAFWLLLVEDTGTPEFWPGSLGFATLTVLLGSLFTVIPGYFLFWYFAVRILDRTSLSQSARKRWLFGPPLAVLGVTLLCIANRLRPSVAIQRVIPRGTPRHITHFHSTHTSGLMWSRQIAWFETEPAELRESIRAEELILKESVDLNELLVGDQILRNTTIPSDIPAENYPVCYSKE